MLALAVVVLVPSLCLAQYAPKWHVGDWWVVKTLGESNLGGWEWRKTRYDVSGSEKVGGRDCFVLEIAYYWRPGTLSGPPHVFHVRADDWLVVRETYQTTYNGTLLPPVVLDRPLGLFGPFSSEPRLPRFPLQLPGKQDTTFKLKERDDCSAYLREISAIADLSLLRQLLDEGDTTGERVVRPTGAVFQVRNELGGNLEPRPKGGEKRIVRSLQFWSDDLPWRLYEECVQYDGLKPARRVVERSWLIAVGHKKR
jgi:hypothetical protein